jgi:hypothetical protein
MPAMKAAQTLTLSMYALLYQEGLEAVSES